MTDTYDAVRRALMLRQRVIAVYRGRLRRMCPHMIGTKMGREKALFYQFGGESQSGLASPGSSENFRCMFLDELEIVEVVDGRWMTAGDGLWKKHAQGCVDWVDIQSF